MFGSSIKAKKMSKSVVRPKTATIKAVVNLSPMKSKMETPSPSKNGLMKVPNKAIHYPMRP
jgi:hypothetical protein